MPLISRRLATIPAVFALAGLVSALPLMAADTPQAGPNSYIEAVKACQPIADPAQRLACYDKAVGEMVAATDKGDLKVIDREQVRETKRKLFGFAIPDFGIFGSGNDKTSDEADEVDSLETTITAVKRTRDGFLLTTSEGAIWEVTEVPRRLMDPKVGQKLELKKAALGSYFLRINGQKGVRGRRVG